MTFRKTLSFQQIVYNTMYYIVQEANCQFLRFILRLSLGYGVVILG